MIKVIQEIRAPELLPGCGHITTDTVLLPDNLQYISITKKVYFLGILIFLRNWIKYGPDYSQTTYYN